MKQSGDHQVTQILDQMTSPVQTSWSQKTNPWWDRLESSELTKCNRLESGGLTMWDKLESGDVIGWDRLESGESQVFSPGEGGYVNQQEMRVCVCVGGDESCLR